MRLKGLDGGLPLPAIVAFVVSGTLVFFFTVLTILMLVTAAMAQEGDEPADCLTSRSVFARTMAETKHPLLVRLPDDLSRRFITAWNNGVRGFAVPPTTDNVTVYDHPRAPFMKIAFFKKDCLVEALDVPEQTFWQVIGAADDTKWRI
jgi:hypothetical protein